VVGHQGSTREDLGQLMKTGAIVAILLTKFKVRRATRSIGESCNQNIGCY
jgi:hypothetical protein